MTGEPPPAVPVTVSAPGGGPGTGGGRLPVELLSSGRAPRPPLPRAARLLALTAGAVLCAGLLVARDVRSTADGPSAAAPVPAAGSGPLAAAAAPADGSLTATATLGGAPPARLYAQRLTLTVVLEPYDGRGEPGGRLLGDEVTLVDVRVRGFVLVPADRSLPVSLGRFSRSHVGRATTVPLDAVLIDCSLSPQAPRELLLGVRTGQAPAEVVRAAVHPELVRALDRVVARTCRRPRG